MSEFLIIILFILVLILIVLAIQTESKQGKFLLRSRQPRPRSFKTKLVCSSLAGLLLLLITVQTWRDVHCYYNAETPPDSITLKAPALPLPALELNADGTVKQARLLLVCIIGSYAPLHVITQEIHWPADKDKNFGLKWESFQGFFKLDSLHDNPIRSLLAQESLFVMYKGKPLSETLAMQNRDLSGRPQFSKQMSRFPFSIYNKLYHYDWYAESFLIPVADDDPLEEISIDQISSHFKMFQYPTEKETQIQKDRQSNPISNSFNNNPFLWYNFVESARILHPQNSNGVLSLEILNVLAVPFLLILLAAFLLAQLFRWRQLAFAFLVFAGLLYLAGLDRLALNTHLKVFQHPASAQQKVIAIGEATRTLFYREKAKRYLGNYDVTLNEETWNVDELFNDWKYCVNMPYQAKLTKVPTRRNYH